MNWLSFIASLVGSLAWPLTIIVVVLIFRRQLLAAAPWLRELELGSLKLKFAEGLAKAATEAEKIEAPPVEDVKALPPAPDVTMLLAAHAPRALVLESWIGVEHALAEAARAMSTPIRSGATTPTMRELERRGLITPEIAKTLHFLRELRNSAVHLPDFAIDSAQALEYARLARQVEAALKAIQP